MRAFTDGTTLEHKSFWLNFYDYKDKLSANKQKKGAMTNRSVRTKHSVQTYQPEEPDANMPHHQTTTVSTT